MRVGVIDVGANTVRLLVVTGGPRGLVPVTQERAYVALGEDVEELGSVTATKLARAAACTRELARRARRLGCERLDLVVTSPGRQSANARVLVDALAKAASLPARVLSAEEEAQLAYAGAVGLGESLPESVGVCDVGGGSTQIVVGSRTSGPVWSRSVDLGSLRLTRRLLHGDPPGDESLVAARAEIERHLELFTPPLPQAALATGGTARALRRLTERELGDAELATTLDELALMPSKEIAAEFGLDHPRARTLLAGTLILAEVQRRLAVPFGVARGGLREGVCLALLEGSAAASA